MKQINKFEINKDSKKVTLHFKNGKKWKISFDRWFQIFKKINNLLEELDNEVRRWKH